MSHTRFNTTCTASRGLFVVTFLSVSLSCSLFALASSSSSSLSSSSSSSAADDWVTATSVRPASAVVRMSRWQRRCLAQPSLACALRPTRVPRDGSATDGDATDGNATGLAWSGVRGLVTFQPTFRRAIRRRRCFVRVLAMVRGLSPGLHGFHIHTWGDVRSSDAKSTGGHFAHPDAHTSSNADKVAHGFPWSPKRHWGDLGNVNASAPNGHAFLNTVDTVIRPFRILGRAVVVHAAPDKGPAFQPSGDAGTRVASCVIGFKNPDLPYAL